MKVGVIVFPGSNCDKDVYNAFINVASITPTLIWHADRSLPDDLDIIVLPGGFSYGDYLRSGAIAARSPIMAEVTRAAEQGRYVIGICNGFQILTEVGLLPGTLLRNKSIKFISRQVYLKVNNTKTILTGAYQQDQVIKIPIAHQDGNYFADENTIKKLFDKQQVVFSYCDESGNINVQTNPNGSIQNIAGITNLNKNVFGLMPHPERAIDKRTGSSDGRHLFQCIVNCLTKR